MAETGKIIQELRIRAGFTQRTLADALHITDKAVSKWERGICLPDISLLPKLSLLLDADMDLLVQKSIEQEEWVGLIDIHGTDLSQTVYDKPLVHYLLIHYLLLDITTIYVLTDEKDREYLSSPVFRMLGFRFVFEEPQNKNMMILNHPWFLFGSDLTQQFQGAMLSERNTKLVPQNQEAVFYFSRGDDRYFTDFGKFRKSAATRTLGRGMVCLDMDDPDAVLDVAAFVKTYQRNARLLIGCLEEVAYRKGSISYEQLLEISREYPYADLLKNTVNHRSVEL